MIADKSPIEGCTWIMVLTETNSDEIWNIISGTCAYIKLIEIEIINQQRNNKPEQTQQKSTQVTRYKTNTNTGIYRQLIFTHLSSSHLQSNTPHLILCDSNWQHNHQQPCP